MCWLAKCTRRRTRRHAELPMPALVIYTCPDCKREFRIPANATGTFACTCGGGKQIPKAKTCIHLGDKIGELDCRCGGKPVVYWCSIYREPCMNNPPGNPWASVKVHPLPGRKITYEPMPCSMCPLRELPPDNLSTSATQSE